MSSTAAPYGLRPDNHPSGVIRPEAGTITSAYAEYIFQSQPVSIQTDGSIGAAHNAAAAVGTFLGVEYTDTATGRPVYANKWTAATAATDIVAYFTRDPSIRYLMQADGSVSQTSIGSQLDWSETSTSSGVANGNTTTGLSNQTALSSSLTSSSVAGLRILGLGQAIDNAWGDAYTDLYVQISKHQDVATVNAY